MERVSAHISRATFFKKILFDFVAITWIRLIDPIHKLTTLRRHIQHFFTFSRDMKIEFISRRNDFSLHLINYTHVKRNVEKKIFGNRNN